MTRKHEPEVDALEVLDRVLTAALREIRELRARKVPPPLEVPLPPKGKGGRVSQPALCAEILKAAGKPMHVTVLLAMLHERGVRATKEGLASALTKQAAPLGPFVRAGRNIFGLAGRDEPVEG